MRYVLPIVLVVIGLVTGLMGILQKTVWAPPENLVATTALSEPGPVTVVEPGVLNLYPTPTELTVEGEGELVIATASKESVDAWVADSKVTRITGLENETTLASTTSDGSEDAVPNPATADLFEATTTGEGSVSLTWDEEAGRTAFLIAQADGEQPASETVTLTWGNDATTPWAIPLMVIGGLLIVGGGALGLRARSRAKAEADRREARRERRRKLAETGAAFAIVPALALVGCAPEELPKAEPAPAPTTAQPVVSGAQIDRILADVASVVAKGDESMKKEDLEARAEGPFLQQREAAYKVKDKSEDVDLPPAVAHDEILVNFAAASDDWPRVTSVVAKSNDPEQYQHLVLIQNDPRDSYRLWSQTLLQPGAEFPSVPDAKQGSTLLGADASGLREEPGKVPAAFADLLSKGDDSESKDLFAESAFAKQIADNQKSQKDALASGKAKIDFEYSAEGNDVIAQETADGGAVVTGYLTATSTITPDSTESTRGELSVPKPASDLVGETKTSKKLEQKTLIVATFAVPAGGDDQIQLIGVSEVLTGAKLL